MIGPFLSELTILVVFCHISVNGEDLLEIFHPDPSLPHELNEWLTQVQEHKGDFRLIRESAGQEPKNLFYSTNDKYDEEESNKEDYDNVPLKDNNDGNFGEIPNDSPKNDIYPHIFQKLKNLFSFNKTSTKKKRLTSKNIRSPIRLRRSNDEFFENNPVIVEPESKVGEIKRSDSKYPDNNSNNKNLEDVAEDDIVERSNMNREKEELKLNDISKREIQIDIKNNGKLVKQIREDNKIPKSIVLNIQSLGDSKDGSVNTKNLEPILNNVETYFKNPQPNPQDLLFKTKNTPSINVRSDFNEVNNRELEDNFMNLFSVNEHLNTDTSLAHQSTTDNHMFHRITSPEVSSDHGSLYPYAPQSQNYNNFNNIQLSRQNNWNNNNRKDMSNYLTSFEKNQMQRSSDRTRINKNVIPQNIKSFPIYNKNDKTKQVVNGFEPAQRIELDTDGNTNTNINHLSTINNSSQSINLENNIHEIDNANKMNNINLPNNNMNENSVSNMNPNDINNISIANNPMYLRGTSRSNNPLSGINDINGINNLNAFNYDLNWNRPERNKLVTWNNMNNPQSMSKIENKRQLDNINENLEQNNNSLDKYVVNLANLTANTNLDVYTDQYVTEAKRNDELYKKNLFEKVYPLETDNGESESPIVEENIDSGNLHEPTVSDEYGLGLDEDNKHMSYIGYDDNLNEKDNEIPLQFEKSDNIMNDESCNEDVDSVGATEKCFEDEITVVPKEHSHHPSKHVKTLVRKLNKNVINDNIIKEVEQITEVDYPDMTVITEGNQVNIGEEEDAFHHKQTNGDEPEEKNDVHHEHSFSIPQIQDVHNEKEPSIDIGSFTDLKENNEIHNCQNEIGTNHENNLEHSEPQEINHHHEHTPKNETNGSYKQLIEVDSNAEPQPKNDERQEIHIIKINEDLHKNGIDDDSKSSHEVLKSNQHENPNSILHEKISYNDKPHLKSRRKIHPLKLKNLLTKNKNNDKHHSYKKRKYKAKKKKLPLQENLDDVQSHAAVSIDKRDNKHRHKKMHRKKHHKHHRHHRGKLPFDDDDDYEGILNEEESYGDANSPIDSDNSMPIFIGRQLQSIDYVHDPYLTLPGSKSDKKNVIELKKISKSTERQDIGQGGGLLHKNSIEGDYGDEEDSMDATKKKDNTIIKKKTENEFANPRTTTEGEDYANYVNYDDINSVKEKHKRKHVPKKHKKRRKKKPKHRKIRKSLKELTGQDPNFGHHRHKPLWMKLNQNSTHRLSLVKNSVIPTKSPLDHFGTFKLPRHKVDDKSEFQHWPTFVIDDHENEEKLKKRSLAMKRKFPRAFNFPLASKDFFVQSQKKRQLESKGESTNSMLDVENVTNESKPPEDNNFGSSSAVMSTDKLFTKERQEGNEEPTCSTLTDVCEDKENFNRVSVEVTTILSILHPSGSADTCETETNSSIAENISSQERLDDMLSGKLPFHLVNQVMQELSRNSQLKNRFNSGLKQRSRNSNFLEGLNETNVETQKLVQSMSNIMNKLQYTATCQALPHNLRRYIKTITRGNSIDALEKAKEMEEVQLDETQNQNNNFIFESSSHGDNFEGKVKVLQDLLARFHKLPEKCQDRAKPVREYIENHLAMLNNMLNSMNSSPSKNGKLKKSIKVDSSTESSFKSESELIQDQLDSLGLGKQHNFKPQFDLDQMVQEKKFAKSSEANENKANERSRNSNVNKRDLNTVSRSKKYNKLADAVRRLRLRRENEKRLGEMYGRPSKDSEDYGDIPFNMKHVRNEDMSKANFESPLVYSL